MNTDYRGFLRKLLRSLIYLSVLQLDIDRLHAHMLTVHKCRCDNCEFGVV